MFSRASNESLEMEDSTHRKSFNEAIENISMPSEYFNDSSFMEPSLTDFSRSKLSEISDVTCTLDCTDYLSKELNEGLKIKKFINKSLEDEINNYKNLLNEVCRARIQRCKTKFVLETLIDMFDNSLELPDNLKGKCNERLQFCRLMKTLNYNNEILRAIGVEDTKQSFVLNEGEKLLIQSVMRKKMNTKCLEMKQENEVILEFLGNQSSSLTLPGTTLTEEKAKILNLVNDIAETVKSCSEEINTIGNLIKELHDLRVCKFQKLHKEEIDCLSSKTQLLALKMKNLNYMIENAIVQQHDNIVPAIVTLHKDLENALYEAEYSLQRTKTVKESYDNLEGTQFREILKEFLGLRESYNHKMWALKQIQNP